MGDGEMGFIPNVFRKIKAKFIQILKGGTSLNIHDALGNVIAQFSHSGNDNIFALKNRTNSSYTFRIHYGS